ncbi:MAG: SagB/ThcOx family dehydrogenase [Calditrichaeota bacterium]|jgi:SagB-type dehydrogenase family enzyme|nr:SagB/ThcOx family dehydrogenase [Calditrichota bacterium]MBT7618857.1 SagB/ThcOx family dehydrogenase [Calditrichota bacterium]MBT7787872.1 SagB/ThcOx family dehydrogenase [Calditrichota bacterium]
MRNRIKVLVIFAFLFSLFNHTTAQPNKMIQLPAPDQESSNSLEKLISQRRSFRDFSAGSLSLSEISQVLWAAQGITSKVVIPEREIMLRSIPSAGALYPLEVFAVVKRVDDLDPGIYRYVPGPGIREHSLAQILSGDMNENLADATLGQDCIKNCAVAIIISSVDNRVAVKYGERAHMYCLIETGHAGQNICLQSNSLGLGAVTVGAFNDKRLKRLIGHEAEPYYIVCIGKKD